MGSGSICGICRHPSDKLELGETNPKFIKSHSTGDRERKRIKHTPINARVLNSEQHEALTAVITSKKKTKEDIDNILRALKDHCIFNNLDAESQIAILDSVKHYAVGSREVIFEQGQPGVCFFCVASGRLEVLQNGERVKVLYPGTGFGEMALLEDSLRTATIKTLEACSLWGVDRNTFDDAIKRMSQIHYEENEKFLSTVPLFNSLTAKQKDSMLHAMVTQKFSCGHTIITEGEEGEMFYIIKEGVVGCYENKVEKRRLGKGDYFGDQALLYNTPRTATITAATDVKLVSIGREGLKQVLGSSLDRVLYRNSLLIAIDKSSILRTFNATQVEALLKHSELRVYSPGDVVVHRGAPKNDKLQVLLKGSIRGPLNNIEIYTCIGDLEIASHDSSPHCIDFIANEDIDVAEITNAKLVECMGGEISQIIIHNEATELLRKVQMFKVLPQEKVRELADALKIYCFTDGQEIVQQNSHEDSFFIIRSGAVKVYKDTAFIRNIAKHGYFGERAALIDGLRSATVLASGDVECWALHKEDFIRIITEEIKEKLMKKIQIQDSGAGLSDLAPVKFLGTGKFGIVSMVTHRQNGNRYALKSVSRHKVEAFGIYENLLLEKNILMQLDHPFIVTMIKTLKDEQRIYFLMEFVKGKDLFDVLLELDTVEEETAKFYMACFLLSVEHLHERNIIHRDLKPENVMIDEEGYPKLIDFGTSKIVLGRTYTTVGTPHYISPEIIMRRGYGTSVDLWNLGIMLYEIIFGKVPFGADEEDPTVIYEKILEHRLDLNASPYHGHKYKNLIKQLLSVNPAARLGGSMEHLKAHPWFVPYNWERLNSRLLKAPYIPKICGFENGNGLNMSVMEFATEIESTQKVIQRSKSIKEIPKNWDQFF